MLLSGGKWKSDYLKSVVICTSCFWGRYSEMRERKWFDWFGVHCTRTLDWRRRMSGFLGR